MNIFKKILYKHKQNKKLYVYVTIKKNDPNTFLCVTLFQEQALEYAMKLLRLNHDEHFRQWCAVRNYNVEDSKSWDEYYVNVVTDEEKKEIGVMKIYYPYSNITAMIRMLCGCNLLGCSFDTDAEKTYYENLKPLKELEEAVNKELDRMQKEQEEVSTEIPEGNRS